MNPEEEDDDDSQSIAPVDKAKTGSASYQANHYFSHILLIFKIGRSQTPPGAQEHVQDNIFPKGAVHGAKVVSFLRLKERGQPALLLI